MKRQQTLLHHFTSRATTSTSQDDNGAQARSQPRVNQDDLIENFDDDMFLAACQDWEEQMLTHPANEGSVDRTGQGSIVTLETVQQPSRPPGPQQPVPQATQLEDLPGFDVSAGNIWIYPTNYPVRDYQFNIVHQALFKNTMVTLPTGLGKTFVAAVVMYNFYRWYPEGKVIFMAPTKPLVAQQIEACYKVMGIPQTDMAEMTGNMPPVERKKAWLKCRTFFLTPQVLMNDLSRRACPAQQVKCLVVDEAHKSLGNHAYCQVVRELYKYSSEFRVLALSATPGSDLKAVQQVLTNLLISHIEIRSEESIDIQRYVHERKVEKVVVPLDDLMKSFRDQYLRILSVYIGRLNRCGALYNQDPATLTKFQILKSREAFRQDPPARVKATGPVEGDYALSISLYHGFELLLQHGLRSLYNFLQSTIDGAKGFSRTRQELMRNGDFVSLMDTLREKFGEEEEGLNRSRLFSSPGNSRLKESKPYVTSHPKMARLQEIVLQHFRNLETVSDTNNPSTSKQQQQQQQQQQQPTAKSTRVMIFAQYRDSVNEIAEMLNRHRPLLRCMGFVGQASSGKNTKGISQKEQLRVVKEFREGGYNTLVSTCVGEEGLDIGDVDLIVCYDAHKSPIRLVQRMGRTGRKRQGRIVMLVTEGKEAAVYDRSQYNKRGIHKALQGNAKSLQLYPNSPRMVPRGINPQPHKMFISIQAFVNKRESTRSSSSASRKSIGAGIDTLLLKAKSKSDKNRGEFLSAEELAYWSANFKLDAAENASLPAIADHGHFATLATKTKRQKPSKRRKSSHPELSLTEWSPWQMSKQPIRFVEHSQRCKHFVELMEFIDLQNLTEGEDIYGLEMQTYLDEEDVIKPKKRGIEQFCTRVSKDNDPENARSDNVGPEVEASVTKKTGRQTAKKRRNPLELMSSPSNSGQSENDNYPGVFTERDTNAVPKIPLGILPEKHGTTSDSADQITSKTTKPRKHKRKLKHLKPKLDSSDDDDFAADNKQEKSPGDRQALTSGDMVAHPEKDGEKVDASMDKIKGFQIVRSPEHEYETPEPMDIDSDIPTSPTFGKVPQSQSIPAVPSSSQFKKTDEDLSIQFLSFPQSLDTTLGSDLENRSGIRPRACEKPTIPPPPPSLSFLDFLDDSDTFNLTQHFKSESSFFLGRKKQKDQSEIPAPVEDMVNIEDVLNSEASAKRMKDEASSSVTPNCDANKNDSNSTGISENQKHNDCSTAKRDDTDILAGIKPNFDLNVDFIIVSDDEAETDKQPQSDKEGNSSNNNKKTPDQGNQAEDKLSMEIDNQTESIMNTPVAFDIDTPQVESILFETDSRTTQKTLPVSSVPSPHGYVQGGDASTQSQQGISGKQSLLGGNKRVMPVFSETPKSRRESVTKPRHAGQLIRDRPASKGVNQLDSRRELNLLEPQEMNKSVSFGDKAQVFDDEDTAEIERMRLQVLGSSEPVFDLGFDLDSLEEDEIEEHGVVPPSPDMQEQQDYINLSQVAARKEQPCSSQSRGMSSVWMRASSTPAPKTKSSLGSISCNELLSPIAQYKQKKCNIVPDKSSKIVSAPPIKISTSEKSSPSIIADIPLSFGKQVQLPKNLDAIQNCRLREENSLTSKKFSRTKERRIIGKRKSSLISTLSDGNPTGGKRRKSAPVGVTSKSLTVPVATDLVVIALDAKDVELMTGGRSLEMEEFVLDGAVDKRVGLSPAPNVRQIVAPSKLLDDSPDEEDDLSQAVQHKKRRKAVVLESPEQPAFKTPNKPSDNSPKKNRTIKAAVSSSDDESPLIRRPKKRRQFNQMMTGIDEDDEDFIGQDSRKKSVSEVKKNSCTDMRQKLQMGAKHANTKQKKTKKPRPVAGEARDFLAEEVEVSTDQEYSSDEEGSDLDNSLEGFINNATQASQASQSALEHSDMHAVYMQSVRSPLKGQIHPAQNRFKMVQRNTVDDDLEIFSQVPVQDESYYESSFVVREGEEDFEEIVRKGRRGDEDDEDESLFENTINPDNIIISKRRGRHKGLSRAAQILKEGRRKVLKTSSSSTSTEETEEGSRRHDQKKPSTGIRKNLGRAPTYPMTSPDRNSGSSIQNTTGKSDKLLSVLSNKNPITDHTQMLTTKLHHVQNKLKRDTGKDSQIQAGDSLAKDQPNNQSSFRPSQGSVIRQFLEREQTTVNSCPSNFTNGKQSTQKQQSPVKSNSVPLRIGNDCLTLAEKEKAERLKRQEEKKREFLRRMEERKKQQLLETPQVQVQHFNQPKPLHGSSSNNAGRGNAQTQLSESQTTAERVPKSNSGTGATRTSVCQSSEHHSGILEVEVIQVGGNKAGSPQTTKMRSPVKAQRRSLPLSPSSVQMTSKTTLAASECEMNRGKPVILVDSKELSSSSHIVSTLALKHNLNPIVSQLSGCDYIVSTRMGVEKKSISDFGSSVNKTKLTERVRHLCELFDRPCLILEKDRVKVSDAKNPKPLVRTKYFDSTLATLSKTHIKVLYSDSLEDTARILADLVRIETRKGSALAPPPSMDSMQEQVFKFYASLPRVSYATAQSMMTAFPCVQQLLNCSQEQLQRRAKISSARAADILSFLHHRFDEQMTCLGTSR